MLGIVEYQKRLLVHLIIGKKKVFFGGHLKNTSGHVSKS